MFKDNFITICRKQSGVLPHELAKRVVLSIPGEAGLILQTLFGTGSAIKEVLRLRAEHFDFQSRTVCLLNRKATRLVPIPTGLIAKLKRFASGKNGFVFTKKEIHVQRAFYRSCRRLEIKPSHTIHGLRMTTARFWQSKGVARSDIQRLLGHASSVTTDLFLEQEKKTPKVPSPI